MNRAQEEYYNTRLIQSMAWKHAKKDIDLVKPKKVKKNTKAVEADTANGSEEEDEDHEESSEEEKSLDEADDDEEDND